MLRDGPYVTADDLLFRLEGVYIAATGRLHALLHPSQPLYTHVDAEDIQERSQHYRYGGTQMVVFSSCSQNNPKQQRTAHAGR